MTAPLYTFLKYYYFASDRPEHLYVNLIMSQMYILFLLFAIQLLKISLLLTFF
jgi:hypothetical protein